MSEQKSTTAPTVIDHAGAKIVVLDHLDPESNAMVQALYSRAPVSVIDHIAKVAQVGSSKFMGSYYVGYGHKSIGDCGTTTVCLENVSMLAAKAVQDWPLYNGQEASTRYLDMSKQKPIDPIGTSTSAKILSGWMALYEQALKELVPYLIERLPKRAEQSQSVYEKAIYAKAFDIARCFLPAGATTFVSWHTNLRQAHDHLKGMEHHPLQEVRSLAEITRQALQRRYPNSFSHKTYPDQEAYYDKAWANLTYFHDSSIKRFSCHSRLDAKLIERFMPVLSSRPSRSELPPAVRSAGDLVFRFLLDFGSFRDLQRQRSVICPMPLLTTEHGFHPWYLEQMPPQFVEHARTQISELTSQIMSLTKIDVETLQYYTAMGFQVSCEVTANLPAAVYVAELRSGQTVHSTLRVVAQQMGEAICQSVPGIAMHFDRSPDEWDIKRGTHDIIKKVA